MINKLSVPVVDVNNPFVNCKLGRKQYSDILSKLSNKARAVLWR